MRFRFSKADRLTRASEFRKVKEEGRACRGSYIVLSVLRTSESASIRVGLVTSRRLGNAVKRNRVRRRLREIARLHAPLVKTGLWYVMIARRDAVTATFRELKQEWLKLAGRAAILREPGDAHGS